MRQVTSSPTATEFAKRSRGCSCDPCHRRTRFLACTWGSSAKIVESTGSEEGESDATGPNGRLREGETCQCKLPNGRLREGEMCPCKLLLVVVGALPRPFVFLCGPRMLTLPRSG